MATSVEDGWRESSRIPRHAPAQRPCKCTARRGYGDKCAQL